MKLPVDIKSVRDYQMIAMTGKPIRKATLVEFSDGTIIKFTEKISQRKAIIRAKIQRKKEFKINPPFPPRYDDVYFRGFSELMDS